MTLSKEITLLKKVFEEWEKSSGNRVVTVNDFRKILTIIIECADSIQEMIYEEELNEMIKQKITELKKHN